MKQNKTKKLITNEYGVTLVELLLSIALLAIIVTPIFGTIYSSFLNNVTSNDRIRAVALSEKVINEIKAKRVIDIPDPANPAGPSYDTGNFKVSSTIQLIDEGSITPSSDYTYNPSEADKPDFDLILESDTTSKTSITINKLNNVGNVVTSSQFTDFPVSTGANLKISQSGLTYSYSFGAKNQADDFKVFEPVNPLVHTIKVRVKLEGDSPLSAKQQLKVFTSIDCDKSFIFYIINNKPENSGISFINKGSQAFEEVYLDTGVIKSDEPFNKLFKITVTVKKNDKVIYTTAAYVKK